MSIEFSLSAISRKECRLVRCSCIISIAAYSPAFATRLWSWQSKPKGNGPILWWPLTCGGIPNWYNAFRMPERLAAATREISRADKALIGVERR